MGRDHGITDIGKWLFLRALAGLPVWAVARRLPRNRWMGAALSLPLILLMGLLAHQGEGAATAAAALTAIHMAMTAAWYGGLVTLFLLPWRQSTAGFSNPG